MKLLFVGDVMLGRLVNEALKREPADYPWGDTLDAFAHADWRMCNLECAISDLGAPWARTPKVFHFRSDAKNVGVLKAAEIDVVSLANNHALDYEEEALFDTLDLLDSEGIGRAGAGRSAAEARRPATSVVHGVRIGVIAFTDNMPEWEAHEGVPGVYYAPISHEDERIHRILEQVRNTATEVDFLVVSAHWGPNWGREPVPAHAAIGRALIDHGADIVFGHSAHILRGVEFYRDRPLLYSTGDFIDDYAVHPVERNDRSAIFLVDTADWHVELIPTIIRRFQARMAEGEDRAAIVDWMTALSHPLGTDCHWSDKRERLELRPSTGG